MKIWKEKIERRGKVVTVHYADFTCARMRHRIQADTKTELDETIEAIKGRARREKYGLYVQETIVTLGELVDARP